MFKNYTPHSITLIDIHGNSHTIPSDGIVRVSSVSQPSGNCNLITCITPPIYGNVEGLPDENGDQFIVNGLVISALVASGSNRTDIFAPATGPNDGVYRENGQIVAVTKLIRLNDE